MPKDKLLKRVKCDTVGDLLDALDGIAKDPELQTALDSSIEGPLSIYTGFTIKQRVLSDKSKVLDFEFT